ncbi:phosphonate C-P lyase system protein PhnH [Nocardia alni]|uniref:phosphonate C-P lyase system protein PhnH n=1 Tax=Nocardia alni TaxID=2815723 RepID=UPI001C24A68C|nr:phosphonate C-P lyase system protein PhnH [Nocardia alni]
MSTTEVSDERTALAELSPSLSQKVFRGLLDAMARPGEIGRIPVSGSTPAALLPVLALADLMTPVHVISGDSRWAAMVSTATGAPIAELSVARLVAALDRPHPDELRALSPASAAEPQAAAQIFVAVSELTDDGPLRLSGPGVPGSRALGVIGLPDEFWSVRDELIEFPAGIDVVLLTADGRLAGIPRSTVIEEY